MTQGQCNCGEVIFAITGEVKDVYFCHCSICRRATGTNGIAVVVVKNEDFNWLSGQELVKTWSKPEHDWQTSFCSNCGSTLPGKNDDSRLYIPAGLLPDLPELQVKHHIWVGSKANWDVIGDGGMQHQEAIDS